MARIVFTLEDGTEIETELDSDLVTIGRHPESMVVLPSSSVSSHHATIKRRGDDYYVQDLGTTNGTKLNGAEVEEDVSRAMPAPSKASGKVCTIV